MDSDDNNEEPQSWGDWVKEQGWELVALFVLMIIITIILLSLARTSIENFFDGLLLTG